MRGHKTGDVIKCGWYTNPIFRLALIAEPTTYSCPPLSIDIFYEYLILCCFCCCSPEEPSADLLTPGSYSTSCCLCLRSATLCAVSTSCWPNHAEAPPNTHSALCRGVRLELRFMACCSTCVLHASRARKWWVKCEPPGHVAWFNDWLSRPLSAFLCSGKAKSLTLSLATWLTTRQPETCYGSVKMRMWRSNKSWVAAALVAAGQLIKHTTAGTRLSAHEAAVL